MGCRLPYATPQKRLCGLPRPSALDVREVAWVRLCLILLRPARELPTQFSALHSMETGRRIGGHGKTKITRFIETAPRVLSYVLWAAAPGGPAALFFFADP